MEQKHTKQTFLYGCLIGCIAFLLLFGVSPLNVTNDAFLRGGYVEKDIQQHYAGWLFYRNADIHFPFGLSQSVSWPSGGSVAFTDSIPLFAVFFRFFAAVLPQTFQYFGWFALLCFALQGGFSALLLQLFLKKKTLVYLGVIPFVFSPILIERAFRHTSLAAQFLIIACLYYYFLAQKEDKFFYKGLLCLNCFSITIHPYFVPMTLAITFALVVQYVLVHKQFLKPLAYLLLNVIATVFVGWCLGVFSGSASGGSGISYGYFCMNLNALWNPSSLGVDWSLFLSQQNQILGNYDGFNYLGLGVLVALVVGGVYTLWRYKLRGVLRTCKAHGALLFVCACLTVFAISNVVTANGALLFHIPLPQVVTNLATSLRSSGRMFWPVYYLLMLAAVLVCADIFKRKNSVILQSIGVFALCTLQLVDLSPALVTKTVSLRNYTPIVTDTVTATTPDTVQTTDFFETIGTNYKHLISLNPTEDTALFFALYCADNGLDFGGYPFTARFDETLIEQQVAAYKSAILAGQLDSDCLYITTSPEVFWQLADAASAAGAWCGVLNSTDATGTQPAVFVIAPDLESYSHPLAQTFDEDFPFWVINLTDDYWQNGVLCLNLDKIDRESDKNKVALFADSPALKKRLTAATTLVCNGEHYTILKIDDSDAGFLMVTLDIADAHILVGQSLQTGS